MPRKFKGPRKFIVVHGDREGGRNYYEHDDRGGGGNDRKVTFKASNSQARKWNKNRAAYARSRPLLNDDDVEMNAGAAFGGRGGGRYMPYRSREGSGRRRPGKGGVRISDAYNPNLDSEIFKITIRFGRKYGKDFVLRSLANAISPKAFVPIGYYTRDNDSFFYVDSREVAEALRASDRKIISTEGYKVNIKISPCRAPVIDLDPSLKERVKRVMGKRYNPDTKALDLTKFYVDPDLVQDVFFSLSRPNAMGGVLDIIGENIPELMALNLTSNGLHTLEHLSSLHKKAPNLNILHIGNNKVCSIEHLDLIQDLPLVELVLDGNPLCDKYSEQSRYVRSVLLNAINLFPLCSEVRKRFPKVVKLDGVELPPQIGFDVEDVSKIPRSQGTFFCSEEGASIARRFLEQYYSIYDSEDRQPLLEAYHDSALFSLSAAYIPGVNASAGKLTTYQMESRNLLKVSDATRRQKFLRQGKLSIVSFLSQLPKTEHDPMSFSVDLTVCTPQLMNLCVSGVFKERDNKSVKRGFSRVFVIVPFQTGFCIANEELFVTNATAQQMRDSFKNPPPPPPPATTTLAGPSASLAGPPSVVEATVGMASVTLDDNVKQQMVVALAEQTGMNLPWANKCLSETEWNFQSALSVFTALHNQQKIPAEAFIK